MTRLPLLGFAVLLAASLGPSALAHDMAAMGGSNAPNGMGSHIHMDEHMKMTPARASTAQDAERADELLDTLRRALKPYHNYRSALAHGYRIFLPTIPQDVYHFTDYGAATEEYRGHFDPARPGSLLYVKNPDGEYALVGAMYSAPPQYTPEQLDALIPLGVAQWHQHVNICLPAGITLGDLLRGEVGAANPDMPGMLPIAASPDALDRDRRLGFMADGRFGFEGSIHDAGTCASAGGYLIPVAFGWMVHVYPFNGDDLRIAFGSAVPKPIAQ